MSFFVIDSYKVGIWGRFPSGAYRYIQLHTNQPGEIDQAVLIFPRGERDYDSVTSHSLHVTLHRDDYEPIYHLLQTESPCYLSWKLNPDGSIRLCSVGTGAEPLGEGLRDRSP